LRSLPLFPPKPPTTGPPGAAARTATWSLYIGTDDGELHVMVADREMEKLDVVQFDSPI